MTLRCNLLGHRRSASRATFDDKHGHWISVCKRCHILLVRDANGAWKPLPPQPDKLEPVARIETPVADESEAEEPAALKASAAA